MRRLLTLFLSIATLGGGSYWFVQRGGVLGTTPDGRAVSASRTAHLTPSSGRSAEALRIASYNIQVFGEEKLSKPAVVEVLTQIVRRFDVVAIQEVRAKNQTVMRQFVDLVNADGSRYDFVLGPRLGRTSSKEQYAFIFDTTRVEIDPDSVYTVEDPEDMLHREPYVAGFRALGAPPTEAFTFTLVDMHIDPDEVDAELGVMDLVYTAVERDGREEDDVILLGDFNANESRITTLCDKADLVYAISGVKTNTLGTEEYDNILFRERATAEFTGRAGVIDILREFNLTSKDAMEVSDHMPIWAEFSVTETRRDGPIAGRPQPSAK